MSARMFRTPADPLRPRHHGPAALLAAITVSLGSPVAFAQGEDGPAEAVPADGDPAEKTPFDKSIEKAEAAMDAGEYEKALQFYEEAKTFDPGADLSGDMAKAHFQLGQGMYSQAKYQEALEHFQDAQGLFPSPAFHYNIAQCYEELDKPERAIESYKAYLRGVPDARDRPRVEATIERLEQLIEERRKEAELAAQLANQENKGTGEPEKEPPPKGLGLLVAGGVLTAAGLGVAVGGGTAFGLQAQSKSDELDDINNGTTSATLAQAEQIDADGQQAQTLQIVMFAVGGAVTIGGAVLLGIGAKKFKQDKAQRDAKAEEKPQVRLRPAFGPRGGGFSLQGRF